MSKIDWVFVDGQFVPSSEARVSPFDRGFLFAHSAYEVTAVYNGKFVDLNLHLARLGRTLTGLEIIAPTLDLAEIHQELITRNEVSEGLVYLQVTAGMQGPRDFYGPEDLTPSVFAFASKRDLIGEPARDGIAVISYEDTRWARRDLKTTQLVSQSLAYRAARRAGATTAVLHEAGTVTEAASANLWVVTADGELITRDLSHALLPGVTRARALSLLAAESVSVTERAFTLDEMHQAREAFTSSTGAMIAPILTLDGKAIGSGAPGPITRIMQRAYYRYIGADLSKLDWL